MNDTERLDWLEAQTKKGACPALLNDDNGHWAVSFEGIQNCPDDGPCDISTAFFVEAGHWHNTIREAIDAAIQQPMGYSCPYCHAPDKGDDKCQQCGRTLKDKGIGPAEADPD